MLVIITQQAIPSAFWFLETLIADDLIYLIDLPSVTIPISYLLKTG
jgi:hypothetical protein